MDLPTACSGTGTALPNCNLPGNHIVACGGFGLNLPVCNLPPQEVPQVCGPTTAGLPPCAPANVQVLACGPTDLGFPPCAFKTLIKAPKPIGLDEPGAGTGHEGGHAGGREHEELHATLSCPDDAAGSEPKCEATVDLAPLLDAKYQALNAYAESISRAYKVKVPDGATHDEGADNYLQFEYRVTVTVLRYIGTLDEQKWSGAVDFTLHDEDRRSITDFLSHPLYVPKYLGAEELYNNPFTRYAVRRMVAAIGAAMDEIQAFYDSARAGSGGGERRARRAADSAKPLFEDHLELRRGKTSRVRLKLPRKVVKKLVQSGPRKAPVVPVRFVVSFDAKPRPIVRFVDFPIRIRR